MPPFKQRDSPDPQVIAAAALALFKRLTPAPWPLARLALVATDFTDLGGGGAGSGAAMARFLAGAHYKQQQQQQPQPSGAAPQQQQVVLQQVSGEGAQAVEVMPEAGHMGQQQQKQCADDEVGQQQQQQLQNSLVAGQQCNAHHAPCSAQGSLRHASTTDGEQQHQQHQAQPVQDQHQQSVVGQHADAAGKPLPAAAPAGASGAEDPLLSDVDVAEQARLLREIELQQLRQRSTQQQLGSSNSSRKRKQAGSAGLRSKNAKNDKQQSISALFGKASK